MVCVVFGEGWKDLPGCAMVLRGCWEGVAWCWGGMGRLKKKKDDT